MQFLSLMGCINGTSFEKKISFRKWKNVMLAAAYIHYAKAKGIFLLTVVIYNWPNFMLCNSPFLM